MASSSSASAAGPGWERYEELAKAAVAVDPHGGTHFFLKTRIQRDRGVQIVSRVASGRGLQIASYRTTVTSRLGRLTRLLWFVMQEALSPAKSALAADTSAEAAATAPSAAPSAASSKNKSKKKGGKKN